MPYARSFLPSKIVDHFEIIVFNTSSIDTIKKALCSYNKSLMTGKLITSVSYNKKRERNMNKKYDIFLQMLFFESFTNVEETFVEKKMP